MASCKEQYQQLIISQWEKYKKLIISLGGVIVEVMKIGFTGTQRGMTLSQMATFKNFIIELNPESFAHGDCIGADSQSHKIVYELGIPIIIHPPINPNKRAFCAVNSLGKILPTKDYLARNKDIVNGVDTLIATPGEDSEVLRSGTWSTIRYCKKKEKKVIIIIPNGLYLCIHFKENTGIKYESVDDMPFFKNNS